jgi:cell division protein FtsI/penicillin-binding protein 2
MDPTNGDILAMASLPSFNPNEFTSSTPEARRNRALTDLYEPGSTMKVLVAAGCLEEKVYNPKSVLYLPSYLKIGKYRIGEAHHRPAGDYTVEQIIVKSYNIGAALMSRSLGKEKVYNYFKSFGFGQKTGIGFPGEQGGQLPPLENWSDTTIYTVAYGQGVSATPLQVLMMFATIANDGLRVKPRLVKQVVDEGKGVVREIPVDPGQKVISSRTAQELRYLLEKVVREGTGQMAAIPGYRVAGKTGTAKKPKIGERGYASGKYVASFAGFLPAREPRVAIIVVVDEPQGPVYGGSVAAPVFKEISEFCARYLRIVPEGAN